MPSFDARAPVIVGTGQLTLRPGDGEEMSSPLAMMAEVSRRAAADAGPGGEGLLRGVQSLAVVDVFSWPVPDPGRLLAGALGLAPAETVRSILGGNGPVALLGDLAGRIARGELEVALLAGGEALTPFMAAMRGGPPTGWPEQPPGAAPTRTVGIDREPAHAAESAAGLIAPIFVYPLFEHALRAAAGRTAGEQVRWIASWWARYTQVAATHPQAWSREVLTAEQIATPAPANRLVSSPYPKVMNANIQVDQAAALLLCSAGAARAAGIPPDRWVWVRATAGAHDHWFVGERADLTRSPAIAAAGRAALSHAGLTLAELSGVDLYSCFPSAVQVAARELGVDLQDPARVPTLTGGLPFFGGPANNYVTHSLATLAGRLREDGRGSGLVTAVGWYLTKHGVAVLSAEPGPDGFADRDVQPEVDAGPRVRIAEGFAGTAPVETYTALYDREGTATLGIVVARTPDGGRAFARSEDASVVGELLDGDPIGREARFDGTAGFGW